MCYVLLLLPSFRGKDNKWIHLTLKSTYVLSTIIIILI